MNKKVYKIAAAYRSLSPVDLGEYNAIKGKGMAFRVKCYDADHAGRLCLMEMSGFFGLMKMETAVFSPTMLDGPLFSFDYIKAFEKDTFLVELYDTTLEHPGFEGLQSVKNRYSSLPSYDPGKHWYDRLLLPVSDYKKGKKLTPELQKYMEEYVRTYFDILNTCKPCDRAEKMKKNAEFTEGLLQNGGPAVNQFKKMIGEEKTEEFLRKYMFCCEG